MKAYTVKFKMNMHSEVKTLIAFANNKEEAYDTAVYDMIPDMYKYTPYSAWVAGVSYNNGNYRQFNTFEGMPY